MQPLAKSSDLTGNTGAHAEAVVADQPATPIGCDASPFSKRVWVKSLLTGIFSRIPEGRARHFLRSAALRAGIDLPRRALVNRGDCVLQVGTPSPETIHYYLLMVGPAGRVIVVEPEESNYNRLVSDPLIACAENVTVLRRAAWSRREQVELTVSRSEVDHKLTVPDVVHDNDYVPDNYCGTQMVQADTIDNIVDELGIEHIDYGEVHVNGAELEVLSGMSRALARISRLHVKGHALLKGTGKPINTEISRLLRRRGFDTLIGPRSKARDDASLHGWRYRSGDVYASR